MATLAATLFPPILAARGRLVQKLIEGDPVAWTITGVVVVGMIGWWAIKKKMGSGE
jgi:hypothetical protein